VGRIWSVGVSAIVFKLFSGYFRGDFLDGVISRGNMFNGVFPRILPHIMLPYAAIFSCFFVCLFVNNTIVLLTIVLENCHRCRDKTLRTEGQLFLDHMH